MTDDQFKAILDRITLLENEVHETSGTAVTAREVAAEALIEAWALAALLRALIRQHGRPDRAGVEEEISRAGDRHPKARTQIRHVAEAILQAPPDGG